MNAGQPWNHKDYMIVIMLFFLASSVYFATTSGITSSNDGSHYALVRTIVENRSFALQQFDDYAEGNDIAIAPDGRLFTDRPPGTALLGTLFYTAGGWLPAMAAELPSRHDVGNPYLLALMLLPSWAGAGAVVLLYAIMRQIDLSRASSLTAAVVYAVGTIHWKYSSVLFSHALSAFLVLLIFFLTIRIARQKDFFWPSSLFLGLVLGYAVLVEYSNALLVPIVITYLLWQKWPIPFRSVVKLLGPLAAGGLVSALFLAFYNASNFGSPFQLSYAYAINYPWASSFFTTFNYPIAPGLRGLLYWGAGDGWCAGTCYNQGIFLLSPILLMAIPGWLAYWRKARTECILSSAIFLVYLLLFAKHRTFHGFTADGRYLAPFLGLIVIPVGFAVAWLLSLNRRSVWQAAFLFIFYGLFYISLRNVFFHIGVSYNYTLELDQLDQFAGQIGNWHYLLGQVFRNYGNLPYLWLLEAVLLFLIVFIIKLRSRLRMR